MQQLAGVASLHVVAHQRHLESVDVYAACMHRKSVQTRVLDRLRHRTINSAMNCTAASDKHFLAARTQGVHGMHACICMCLSTFLHNLVTTRQTLSALCCILA